VTRTFHTQNRICRRQRHAYEQTAHENYEMQVLIRTVLKKQWVHTITTRDMPAAAVYHTRDDVFN